MNSKLKHKQLSVNKSPIHGYGVFAEERIEKEEIIEECYCLLTDKEDKSDYLKNYYYEAGKTEKSALVMGFGFIYNHADSPNCSYYYDESRNVMVYYARSTIETGEEIFVSYGNDWFDGRNAVVKKIAQWEKVARYMTKGPRLKAIVTLSCLLLLVKLCSLS